MVAVERQQDGSARRQPDDAAFVAVYHHLIIVVEGLAQAEQQAGNVIFNGVAQGETDRQPDHAGGAEHGAEQGRGVEYFEGEDEAASDDRHADDLPHEVAQEGIAAEAPHQRRVARDKAGEPPENAKHRGRHRQQRQKRDETARRSQQAFHRRQQAAA